jgi:hypothetical protein
LIRDPNAATRNFDPTEIDTLAREMLASGDTIAPIPLAMTKPIGEGVDGDGEYAPIAGFKALAAANRARELDPMFDKVASNFVDLDNPAEVEQLRRFYGGETGGSAGKPKSETRQALEANGFSYRGVMYKGKVLGDALDSLADRIERDARSARNNPNEYPSNVSDAVKEQYLRQALEDAQSVRDGTITGVSWAQYLGNELTGQSTPLL